MVWRGRSGRAGSHVDDWEVVKSEIEVDTDGEGERADESDGWSEGSGM